MEPTPTAEQPAAAPDTGTSAASVNRRWLVARVLLGVVAVLAVVGAVVGAAVLDRISSTYDVVLGLTRDSAAVAADAAGSASEIADGVSELANGASSTLLATQKVLDSAADSADGIGVALSTNVADAVEGGASIVDRLAGVIQAIEKLIPGNRPSIAEDMRTFSDGLEPVPDQLRDLGDQLAATSDQLEATSFSLGPVAGQLSSSAADISAATADIEAAQVVADEISARAQAELDESNSTFGLAKVLLYVFALVIVGACIAGERAISGMQHRVRAVGLEPTLRGTGT
jgi:hypothetical protein